MFLLMAALLVALPVHLARRMSRAIQREILSWAPGGESSARKYQLVQVIPQRTGSAQSASSEDWWPRDPWSPHAG